MSMTSGQVRATRELTRLAAFGSGGFQVVGEPTLNENGMLFATVRLRVGHIETAEGGLPLRETEDFVVGIHPDFPFRIPLLKVSHRRFEGFDHVIWGNDLCLYQTIHEWIPAAGLCGFFDRLRVWLAKAAINEMDPLEGPLEPPHHVTDFSQHPFVIRADAPCEAGESWVGLAVLEKHRNRIELEGWRDLSAEWPEGKDAAFAVILPRPISMEFPSKGGELFMELENAGIDKLRVVKILAWAAMLSAEGDPLHLVMGLPMRRGPDGSPRLHIAVWTMDEKNAGYLRNTIPKDYDTLELGDLRVEFRDALTKSFESSTILWCRVLEDRSEIVVRRDRGTSAEWLGGKRILLLGCGGIGSWVAEIVMRSNPATLHLVDSGMVKPGVLARQNFDLEDIGGNKAEALAERLKSLGNQTEVEAFPHDAHQLLAGYPEFVRGFDLVIDCTASSIFQMKLERDWPIFGGANIRMVSLAIDARARHILGVAVAPGSPSGIWDAYLLTKWQACSDRRDAGVLEAFYSEKATEHLFQPEPGCSDPTFVGSCADVMSLATVGLDAILRKLKAGVENFGFFWTRPLDGDGKGVWELHYPRMVEVTAGGYRIRISSSVFSQARSWARKNARELTSEHETGGLLWGTWDDAVGCIWVLEASGPPPDSVRDSARFDCGVVGTQEEQKRRMARSYGLTGFVGHWHTHPDFPSEESRIDLVSMAKLVSVFGGGQKRSLMLIFGRTGSRSTAGIYVYESQGFSELGEVVNAGSLQFELDVEVV